MHRRAAVVTSLIVLGCIAFAGPAAAETGDMLVRFGLVLSSPTGDYSAAGQTTELDGATGLFGSFEYGLTDTIGIEPSLTSLSYDITVQEAGFPDLDFGSVDLLEIAASVNFHLLDDGPVDLYAGPVVGYALWGDVDSDVFMTSFSTDDEFVFGGILGVDVPFGDGRWSFAGALRYTLSDLSVQGGSGDLGVDPIDLSVGLAYRF